MDILIDGHLKYSEYIELEQPIEFCDFLLFW